MTKPFGLKSVRKLKEGEELTFWEKIQLAGNSLIIGATTVATGLAVKGAQEAWKHREEIKKGAKTLMK